MFIRCAGKLLKMSSAAPVEPAEPVEPVEPVESSAVRSEKKRKRSEKKRKSMEKVGEVYESDGFMHIVQCVCGNTVHCFRVKMNGDKPIRNEGRTVRLSVGTLRNVMKPSEYQMMHICRAIGATNIPMAIQWIVSHGMVSILVSGNPLRVVRPRAPPEVQYGLDLENFTYDGQPFVCM